MVTGKSKKETGLQKHLVFTILFLFLKQKLSQRKKERVFGTNYVNLSLKKDETYKVVCIKATFFLFSNLLSPHRCIQTVKS